MFGDTILTSAVGPAALNRSLTCNIRSFFTHLSASNSLLVVIFWLATVTWHNFFFLLWAAQKSSQHLVEQGMLLEPMFRLGDLSEQLLLFGHVNELRILQLIIQIPTVYGFKF